MTTPADLLAHVLSGKAPAALRLAAARGAVPLSPDQILRLQVHLRNDGDEEVRRAARESLRQPSAQAIESLRTSPDPDGTVLAYLLEERPDLPAALRQRLLALRSIDGALVERVAARESSAEVLESLVNNQQLLRGRPSLVSALRSNPALPADLRRRLEDLVEHLPGAAAPVERAPEAAREIATDGPPPAKDPELAALGVDAEVEAMLPLLDLDVGDLLSHSEIQGAEDLIQDSERADTYQKIIHLNVAQKLRLALFGSREERMILVRDTNRMIATAAVKNPRATEQELELISVSRNVIEEVLVELSRRREAMKRYSVLHNLVRNPKVPAAIALRLIPRLRDRDLKLLEKNRNVSDVVRTTARKQIMARAQRQKISYRKGH